MYVNMFINLFVYNMQINEATSYEKFGMGSFFKQLVSKISLERIILVELYRQPEQSDRKKN